jgi:hypothetical protein
VAFSFTAERAQGHRRVVEPEPQASRHRYRRRNPGSTEVIYGSTEQSGIRRCNR